MRYRRPSNEGDDVSADNSRRKLDTTTDVEKSPTLSLRFSPLVVKSASRKRQRQNSEKRNVYGLGAVADIEQFAQNFVQNEECRNLAYASTVWEQSQFGIEPEMAQLLAVAINAAAKVVANTDADYQLIRKSKKPEVIREADGLHRKLAQWRRGSFDYSLPLTNVATEESPPSVSSLSNERELDANERSSTAVAPSSAENISTDSFDHLVELSHDTSSMKDSSVWLLRDNTLETYRWRQTPRLSRKPFQRPNQTPPRPSSRKVSKRPNQTPRLLSSRTSL